MFIAAMVVIAFAFTSCSSSNRNEDQSSSASVPNTDTTERDSSQMTTKDSVRKEPEEVSRPYRFKPIKMEVDPIIDKIDTVDGIGEGGMAEANTFKTTIYFIDSLKQEHPLSLEGIDYLKVWPNAITKADVAKGSDIGDITQYNKENNYKAIKAAFNRIVNAPVADLFIEVVYPSNEKPKFTVMVKTKIPGGKKIGNASVRSGENITTIYEDGGN